VTGHWLLIPPAEALFLLCRVKASFLSSTIPRGINSLKLCLQNNHPQTSSVYIYSSSSKTTYVAFILSKQSCNRGTSMEDFIRKATHLLIISIACVVSLDVENTLFTYTRQLRRAVWCTIVKCSALYLAFSTVSNSHKLVRTSMRTKCVGVTERFIINSKKEGA